MIFRARYLIACCAISARLFAGSINFTITTTVDAVDDAVTAPGAYSQISPIQLGDLVTYSVSANPSTCNLGTATATFSDFSCTGATDGATITFQTAGGPLTFSSVGVTNGNIPPLDLRLSDAPGDDYVVFTNGSTTCCSTTGSWDAQYAPTDANPPYSFVQSTAFPTSLNLSLANQPESFSFGVIDAKQPSGWAYLVYASPDDSGPSAPEPACLLLTATGLLALGLGFARQAKRRSSVLD